LTLENKSGPRIQGQYETQDGEKLTIRSQKNGTVLVRNYERGKKVSARWERDGKTIKLVQYDAIEKITEVISELGHFNVQYEPSLDKPSMVTMKNVGVLFVTYDSEGDILKVSSTPNSLAVKISNAFNKAIDGLDKD
jgi:hypothetical protein